MGMDCFISENESPKSVLWNIRGENRERLQMDLPMKCISPGGDAEERVLPIKILMLS